MKRFLEVACLATVVGFSLGATTVFNNTTLPTGPFNILLDVGQIDSLEHANQITLASYERIVTNFTLRMRIGGGGAATFKLHVRFYKNDGPSGSPGSLLWYSGPINAVIDSGAEITYTIPVPNIRVPNSFSYSVQATDRAIYLAAAMGPAENSLPIVGSVPFGFWRNFGAPNGWEYVNPNEAPFEAKVDAIPISGDVDSNGVVDIDDLVAVINGWGPCAEPCPPFCEADVTEDCTVNIDDLLAVINGWG
jgi:hypothetical protein